MHNSVMRLENLIEMRILIALPVPPPQGASDDRSSLWMRPQDINIVEELSRMDCIVCVEEYQELTTCMRNRQIT